MKGVIRVGHGMWNGNEHKKKVTTIVTEKKKFNLFRERASCYHTIVHLIGLSCKQSKTGDCMPESASCFGCAGFLCWTRGMQRLSLVDLIALGPLEDVILPFLCLD